MAGRIVGNYVLESHIGSGSFSVVWRAKHIYHHDHKFAIKEIDIQNSSQKLRECLLSEINILKQIKHPNIIQLYDTFNEQGRIFLVLEYCNGGDLFSYIQRYGSFSEAVARDFIIQLAAGLKVLRENSLIHRDLKPQNLLLSKNGGNTVLKIADFGFARLLQPQLLAETLCGSPLYMAPEIMQSQKYDAKADLWSVGAILFQLVTGRPPYFGNSQIDLMKNIMKSDEMNLIPSDIAAGLNPDCVDLCKRLLRKNPAERLSFEEFFNHRFVVKTIDSATGHESSSTGSNGSAETPSVANSGVCSVTDSPKGIMDFAEDCFEEEDYVFVDSETLSSALDVSGLNNFQHICAPVQTNEVNLGSILGQSSMPLGTSQASVNSPDALEKPSDHPPTRLDFLQRSAHLIAEIAREKIQAGQQMEAFAIQLVCLAVWKQAVSVSSEWAAEVSCLESDYRVATALCSEIKQEFVREVESTEQLASHLGPALEGNAEMPDAMQILLQISLALGRKGAMDELCGAMDNSAALYSKSRALLSFILVEASSLELNPPFSIGTADRQRLRLYVESLTQHNQSTPYSRALDLGKASKVCK